MSFIANMVLSHNLATHLIIGKPKIFVNSPKFERENYPTHPNFRGESDHT